MQKRFWKIGELASQVGVSVRTLHHYHKLGLLVPSEFTKSGHRLYSMSDIAKLQQIISLKQMGLTLDKIQIFIENQNLNKLLLVQEELESISEQIKLKEKLRHELEQLHTLMTNNQDIVNLYIFFYFFQLHTVLINNQNISVYQLYKLMELIQINGSGYLTEEQMEKMKNLSNSFTEDQKLEMQNQWNTFMLNLNQNTENNIPIADTSLEEPDIHWKNTTTNITNNDFEMVKAIELFKTEHLNNPLSYGLISEMYNYLQIAIEKL